MSLPDPLSSYLGLPDSTGEMSGNTPSIPSDTPVKV